MTFEKLHICPEIGTHEGYAEAWPVRPASAVIELMAVTVFALSLGATCLRPVGSPDIAAH